MVQFDIGDFPSIFNNILETDAEFILIGTPLHPKLEELFVSFVNYSAELSFFEDQKICIVVDHKYYFNMFKEALESFLKTAYSVLEHTVKIYNLDSEESIEEEIFDIVFLTKEFSSDSLKKIPAGKKNVVFCLNTPTSLFHKFGTQEKGVFKITLTATNLELDNNTQNINLIQGFL